jgi:hypothetical protein
MQIGKAFSYPFEDPDWMKKIGIAAAIMLIPLVGAIVVSGWGVEVAHRVIRKEEHPLPEWNDFGGYLVKGLKVIVISFIYLLPIILVSICPSLLVNYANNQSEDIITAVATVISVCFSCLIIIYGVLAGLVLPAAMGKFAATGELKAAFRFGEVIRMVRAKPMVFVMALLGGFVSSLIASAGTILCFIGVLATVPYSMAINGHLWGQAYLEAGQDQVYAPTVQM